MQINIFGMILATTVSDVETLLTSARYDNASKACHNSVSFQTEANPKDFFKISAQLLFGLISFARINTGICKLSFSNDSTRLAIPCVFPVPGLPNIRYFL